MKFWFEPCHDDTTDYYVMTKLPSRGVCIIGKVCHTRKGWEAEAYTRYNISFYGTTSKGPGEAFMTAWRRMKSELPKMIRQIYADIEEVEAVK